MLEKDKVKVCLSNQALGTIINLLDHTAYRNVKAYLRDVTGTFYLYQPGYTIKIMTDKSDGHLKPLITKIKIENDEFWAEHTVEDFKKINWDQHYSYIKLETFFDNLSEFLDQKVFCSENPLNEAVKKTIIDEME